VTADATPEAAGKAVLAAGEAGGAGTLTRQPLVPLRGAPDLHLHLPEQLRRLREATLDILDTVGVRFDSPEALEVLADHGARVDKASRVVTFPPDLVLGAMARAPRQFTLAAREPAFDLPLREGVTYATTDGSGTEVVDWRTRERRASTKADVADIARLLDYLPSLAFWWPTVTSCDCAETGPLHDLDAAWNNTVKHLQGMVMGEAAARYAVEMATVVAGSPEALRARPVLSDLICPVSPLVQDRDAIEAALVLAAAGVPIAFCSSPTMGMTTPATPAGAYALAAAEVVSASVLVELAHPGAPVLQALIVETVDPRNGRILASPLNPQARFLATALIHSWGVPALAGFGGTDAELPGSWQAAVEQTQGLVLAVFDGAETMATFGLTNAYTLFSPEQIMLDHDIYMKASSLLGDLATDEEQLALDVIRDVGPGGHFLSHRHTRRHMKEAALPAISHEPGADGRYRDPREVARERAEAILRDYHPEPLAGDQSRELMLILDAADRELRR
jgi:trimethylamine---corrinoid protein Co-methyltransferase